MCFCKINLHARLVVAIDDSVSSPTYEFDLILLVLLVSMTHMTLVMVGNMIRHE